VLYQLSYVGVLPRIAPIRLAERRPAPSSGAHSARESVVRADLAAA
jgi:hypothetical protein